ncbi:hypothetical protein [Helicobacter sp. MIT 14-3879]|uniref:hypothetical protein n=1 Tax=Helicobacter sp. MIT 14-3879 TaxID=2040649 RepID=UPI000E1EB2EE|nr:hypothetical protein [Helicobacter sp. MIT 14-3879]RDU63552.1 hypothetical protein CQA44_05585 [Helicobacter sp. MIT 14-3879]
MNTKFGFSLGVLLGMLIIFISVAFFSWNIKGELLNLYILGNELKGSADTNKTLEVLISENKLISAKDFFGFYISYYNNFIVILSCIIGAFAITSFIYIRNKNEETNEKIKNETKEQIDNFLKDNTNIKMRIQEVTEDSIKDIMERMEKIENDIIKIQDLKEMQETNKEIAKEITTPMTKD